MRLLRCSVIKSKAKPFLKWAGGKNSLIPQISEFLPTKINQNYCEGFLGGGAMFFYLVSNFEFKKIILNDISVDLMTCYAIVKNQPAELVKSLERLKDEFLSLSNKEQEEFYYLMRDQFNYDETIGLVDKSALFIFLNKTCFNGLYRLNKNGKFNVPFAFPKNPSFFDEVNIYQCSVVLQDVMLTCGDFQKLEKDIDGEYLVYLDPPYRPVTKTASFNNYSGMGFGDEEQVRLSNFVKDLSLNNQIMLSNSDDGSDFFEKLYDESFVYNRISAKRNINRDGEKRGKVRELLLCNF